MKQKKETVLLAGLVIVAAAVWYYNSRGSTLPSGTTMADMNYKPMSVENSQLHWDRLEQSRSTAYKTNGRNLFSAALPAPKVKPKPTPTVTPPMPVVEAPPPALTLPTNMKFFGYGTLPSGAVRRAFFSDGEDVFIVGEGDMLLGRFRILRIGNSSIDFEEISSGRRGQAPIEEQQGPSA